ncbi:MAG: hypothetical protein HRT43_05965 [Campylobacteraceae bacterium]|nr:hypothetical protein [Campylobacteraceae bacterium]
MFHFKAIQKLLLLLLFISYTSIFAHTHIITLATDSFEPYYGPKLINNGYLT